MSPHRPVRRRRRWTRNRLPYRVAAIVTLVLSGALITAHAAGIDVAHSNVGHVTNLPGPPPTTTTEVPPPSDAPSPSTSSPNSTPSSSPTGDPLPSDPLSSDPLPSDPAPSDPAPTSTG